MRSLRYKIFALAVLLVVLTLAGTIGTVLLAASHDAQERTRTDLARAGAVLERIMRLRSEQAADVLYMLAGDDDFEAALARGEHDTLSRMLARVASRIDADLAVLADGNGHVLAGLNRDGPLPAELPQLAESATGHDAMRRVLSSGGISYTMTSIPVGGPAGHATGWLSMGLRLGDARAQRTAQLGGQDIAFLTGPAGHSELAGTSLPGIDPALLQQQLAAAGPDAALRLRIAGTDYLAVMKTLLPGPTGVQALLFQSMDQTLAPYRVLRWSALGVGMFALLAALAGAAVLARTMVHPLRELADAAARVRNGDYSHTVRVSADDEFGVLAAAFNTMQGGIAEREERITYQARFDSLTGLPNRLLALEQLREAVQRAGTAGRPVSLLVMDLGNFDDIAATLGHDIGDALLSQVGERLRASADAHHTVARLESDEFLVILEGLGLDAARELAEDLLRLLGLGLSVRNINISLDAVVGMALYPEHGQDADQLLLRATVAKNDAHKLQEPLHLYQDGQEERRVRQLAILGDLRRAVRHDELKLYLQPKISLADGRVCGAEALVRWDHPAFGWLLPGDFIGVAEQFGNISLVTRWALTAAVRECRLWVEEGLDLSIAVNLASRDLRDETLPLFILQLLRDHDLPARHLTVELTEEALVRDFSRATAVLQGLKDLGVRVSIDDFGTGYSSLARIKHLPVDELKIDRSFVMELPRDQGDAAIIRTVLDLAHSLGLEVVAEGVESAPALQWLAAHGCEQAQGFHISRPMPAEAFSEWAGRYTAAADLAMVRRMVLVQAV